MDKIAVIVVVCLGLSAGVRADPTPPAQGGPATDPAAGPAEDRAAEAARHFDRGTALYAKGLYQQAVEAYAQAQALAPHPTTLFNMARCHENLGQTARALSLYEKALTRTRSPAERADIQQRVAQLRKRPVEIFVSSQPPGAQITVDAAETAQKAPTPTVVRLAPGAHLLRLSLKGHHLGLQRVEVRPGEPQTVHVHLHPETGPPPPKPCPEIPDCPPPRLHVPGENSLQVAALGGIGVTTSRDFSAGGGVQVQYHFGRLIAGLNFQAHSAGSSTIPVRTFNEMEANTSTGSWVLLQADAGYLVSFDNAYLYAAVGLGFAYDRVKFLGWRQNDMSSPTHWVSEELGFAWSVALGAEVFFNRWLSLGGQLRAGMIHGDRADVNNPPALLSDHNFPFGTLSLLVSFHV